MLTQVVKEDLHTTITGDNGLDFIEAVESFVKWRSKLMKLIEEYPCNENLVGVQRNQKAEELGVWLNGVGFESYGKLESFCRLVESHDEFHQVVAMVIDKTKAGELKSAEALIRELLAQLTRRVLTDLNEFHAEVHRISA